MKRALVVTGDGINCEKETAEAFALAGFQSEIRHLNDLIFEKLTLDGVSSRYSVIAFPGGFSFGDDLGSGKVLALKIGHALRWDLREFARRGGLVLGVCNGFQALIKLGVFGKDLSITHNIEGKFIDTWVQARPVGSRCLWLRNVEKMDLPVRHGEGRIVLDPSKREPVRERLNTGAACLRYERDVNGSEDRIAGLCDETGRIFGLMPHPEAFVRATAHPEWTARKARGQLGQEGDGLAIFKNAYQEASR